MMVLLLLLYPLAIYQEAKTGPGTVFINHSDVFVLSSLVSTENQGTKKKKPIQVVQDISSFQDLADVLLLGKV